MIPSLMVTSAAQIIAMNTSRIRGRDMIKSAALFAALHSVLGFGFIGDLGGFQGLDDPVEHAGWQCWVERDHLLAFDTLEVLDFHDDLDVVRFCNTSHVCGLVCVGLPVGERKMSDSWKESKQFSEIIRASSASVL